MVYRCSARAVLFFPCLDARTRDGILADVYAKEAQIIRIFLLSYNRARTHGSDAARRRENAINIGRNVSD